jgi:ElaB/YqjD/DUF883 family membrane-anchored ribosome-binding protein
MATSSSTTAQTTGDSNDSMTAVQRLREQADAVVERIQPQIAAVSSYAREEPTKALLISAAAGAALMGLFALVVRSGSRSPVESTAAAGRSALAAIRDAALDLADSAQGMAADAVASAKKRVAGTAEESQKRAASSADSVSDAAADAWKKVRDQAAPLVEKVRDQAGPLVDKIRPQIDAAAAYAKDEPVRAAIGLAAAGAIIAGLIALTHGSDDDEYDSYN